MRRACLLLVLLGGCVAQEPAWTAAMVSADAAEVGQLFCQDGAVLLLIAGVLVTGATSLAVEAACRAAAVLGSPAVPLPVVAQPGAMAVVVSVPPGVMWAVAASAGP